MPEEVPGAHRPRSVEEVATAERRRLMQIGIYSATFALTAMAMLVGALFMAGLRSRIYFIGPAFLVMILVIFYGLAAAPVSFSPAKVSRYTVRPRAVDALSRLLRSHGRDEAAKKMHEIYRNALCAKLQAAQDCDDEALLASIRAKHPVLHEAVVETLSRKRALDLGKAKGVSAKQFNEDYNKMMNILASIDGGLKEWMA